ncbi:MAG: glycosyltransferase family 1 protein [Sutterella sp.]|nr:glycosyltransferase family 1 protein [Sutterella sp.]
MQTDSRFRGIGNYSRQLATALCKNLNEADEIHILLNGGHPDKENTLDVRRYFSKLIPNSRIHCWYPPYELPYKEPEEHLNLVDTIYSEYINYLNPDVLLILSPIEGPDYCFYTTFNNVNKDIVKVSVVYDYIIKKWKDFPLRPWYDHRLSNLARADLLLGISYTIHQENKLNYPNITSVNIDSDVSELYNREIDIEEWENQKNKQHITKPYFLYSGSLDDRKNVGFLLAAYSLLPEYLKEKVDCLIVSGKTNNLIDRVIETAKRYGLKDLNNIHFLDYVKDEELKSLYQHTKCFIFPSTDEGFGMPVLEAMRCGAAVIGSNVTSIPEIINNEIALFDPYDVKALTDKLAKIINDDSYHEALVKNSLEQQSRYSWNKSSKIVLNEIKGKCLEKNKNPVSIFNFNNLIDKVKLLTNDQNIDNISRCLAKTFDRVSLPCIFVDYGEFHKANYTKLIEAFKNLYSKNSIQNINIIPVKWSHDYGSYVYDKTTSLQVFNRFLATNNEIIDYSEQDIFWGINVDSLNDNIKKSYIRNMQMHGVKTVFNITDQDISYLAGKTNNESIKDILHDFESSVLIFEDSETYEEFFQLYNKNENYNSQFFIGINDNFRDIFLV